MKEKVVDLYIEQVLLRIDPIVAAADCGRNFPALSRRAEGIRAGDGKKVVLLQKRTVIIGYNIALHSPPCNEQTILCNDQTENAASYCQNDRSVIPFLLVSVH